MSAIKAIIVGFRRALGSPFILLWLWLINLAVAVPATWAVTESLREEIGSSRVHDTLRESFDWEWYDESRERARGLEQTFTPTVVGAGAFYDNLEAWLTGELFTRRPLLTAIGGGYVLIWILMLGGVVDRYAHRDERSGPRRFFGAGGRFFFRFLRLAIVSGVLYAAVFLLADRLFDKMEDSTRDVTVEGTILLYSMLIWGLSALLLTLIHMSFGYAKIATVVEDRRSVLLAALRGLWFVATHPTKALGQYYGILVVSALLLAIYSLIAPGAGQSGWRSVVWAFLASQLFLLARLLVRLGLLAGQVALYQTLTTPPAGTGSDFAPPETP